MNPSYKVLDLFSGIGGFSLGLERAGFETVAFCEIEPFCQKVLKKHWPKVKIYNDITSAKFKEDVDLVTAGFPCQDISFAGDGAGLTGDRSGLFWYILRTLCMVGRPKALLENVAALLHRGMGVVLGALASFGYDTEWHCISAASVGAPHIRDRVWIYCHPNESGESDGSINDETQMLPRDDADPDKTQLKRGSLSGRILEEHANISDPRWGKDKPGVDRTSNGVPSQMDRLGCLGNAVVPQIPELIGRAILEDI